jgi:hypothetical protein
MQGIDTFNRENYKMLTGQGYEMPATSIRAPPDVRYAGASRRYSDNSADFRSLMQRPIGESTHQPDPLFGAEINAANAMPSEYSREKLTPSTRAYRERDRSMSMARSEPDYTRSEPIPSVPSNVKSFHLSYPEIAYYNLLNEDFSLHQPMSMHQSLPNIAMSKHEPDDNDRKVPAKEIEPIPFDHIHIPGRRSFKPTSQEKFTKKVSMAPYTNTGDEVHTMPQSQGAVPGQRISRELMECLDKMTYHSIADDNPFEPIPLAPQQESAHIRMRRSIDLSSAANLFQNPMIDESEHEDEFAEG